MSDKILITTGDLVLTAELNDTETAKKLKSLLPLQFSMSRWGDEYYGDCGIRVEQESGAKVVMEIGELAVWPVGSALCIFFGPTPVSVGDEPRAASSVNPVGKLIDDPVPLKKLKDVIKVTVSNLN
ncbi:MAG: hypothetical protein HQK88_06600 [Nitrospirae bacterium]|nr:hypothetical protein [Nitrospirota bacterium]MBF0534796.1 hypothetical protein [Nitrospirota bacterium]MBF0616470.1 hypothetical protein [Nitrospirota bacterium]